MVLTSCFLYWDEEVYSNDTKCKMVNKSKELLNCRQKITFKDAETESHELCCSEVLVECGIGVHTSGSSNVKLRNIVDFNWELKNYPGQLIAVHIKGNFFAYGLKTVGPKSADTTGLTGMVRVVSRVTGQRSLIRGFRGMVQDMAFSHLHQHVVLASADDQGVLLVYHIQEKENSTEYNTTIMCTPLLHVEREKPASPNEIYRIVWCPYIPEEGVIPSITSEVGQLLVYTHGPYAELWSIPMVNQKYGPGPHKPSQIQGGGLLSVPPLDSVITDAAFSPDGTALAIATAGGLVSFFQVYMQSSSAPRCLHSWRPHGEKPLSMLRFLDNHQDYNSEIQFWKWAITGAQDNSEIKLWACESWTCLQTINFEPSPIPRPSDLPSAPQRCILKAVLDLSSSFVVLSDMNNRMLYVLHMQMDKGTAHISIISGFTVPQPAISFGIVEARLHPPRALHDRPDGEEEDRETEFDSLGIGESEELSSVVLDMLLVQPKSLQECNIAFKVDPKPPTLTNETLVFREDSGVAANGDTSELPSISTAAAAADLTGTSLVLNNKTPVAETLNTSSNTLNNSGSLNLMTPDAFSSPARHEDSPSRSSNVSSSGGSVKRVSHTPPAPQSVPVPSELQQALLVEPKIAAVTLVRDGALTSGGSSPSREVQQILAAETSGEIVENDYFEEKVEQLIDVQDVAANENKPPVETEATYWPQIQMLLNMEDASQQQEPLMPTPSAPVMMPNPTVMVPNEEFLVEIRDCLQTLTRMVDQQQNEIKELRREVACSAQKELQESVVCSIVERVLAKQLQRQSHTIDKILREKLNELRDSLASAFTKSVDSIVSARLGQGFHAEVQSQLVPVVLNTLQPLHDIIHSELTKKLTATDHLLKENLERLATSQAIQDSIAVSLATALQGRMSNCFRDVIFSTVVPIFEKSCKALFAQLDETFARGTREQLAAIDAHCEKQRQRHTERIKDTTNQINTLSEAVRLGNDATANMVRAELHTVVAKAFAGLQEAVTRSSRDAVTETITRTLKEVPLQSHPSRSATPQPLRTDPQTLLATVTGLVNQGQLNSAFQMALSASDLSVVVNLCERLNPQQVFSKTPCLLQQPVLLSLIQQLSADLTVQTELKHKYLEEAIMNLDRDDAVTREHIPGVLLSLQKQLTAYIQTNPNNRLTRSMRVLLMATNSLIKP